MHKKMSIMQDKKLLDWKNKMEHVAMYLVVAVVVVLVVGIGATGTAVDVVVVVAGAL